MDLADSRQESTRDRWVQQQMEDAMKHLPSDLEVVPSPLLLEEMELAPAGPGCGHGAVDLFTFLSRKAERTLRRSAGLSVPQSAYDRSRLAIPCPGTVKPSSSSRRRKRRRGAPSCVSAGEEESPTAAAATPGAMISLPADVSAAASHSIFVCHSTVSQARCSSPVF
ncbi:hypothetical protein CRENBAI_020157 [Crenichthys baileyi]|uniref:Uncharacterized protein n=1 Tax=Crenichthys baileyi TaxID=28760 RepID=A0AAV9R7F1_9TELE